MEKLTVIQRHATERYVIARHPFKVGVAMIAQRLGATPQEVINALRLGAIRTDNSPIPSIWSL